MGLKLKAFPGGNTIKHHVHDKIIREYYPDGGAKACAPYIKGLTLAQITRRANYIGISMTPEASNRNKGRVNDWVRNGYDDIIRKLYPDGGSAACQPSMPEMDMRKISGRARTLKVVLSEKGRKKASQQRALKAAKTRIENELQKKAMENQDQGALEQISSRYLIDRDNLDIYLTNPVPPSVLINRLKPYYW